MLLQKLLSLLLYPLSQSLLLFIFAFFFSIFNLKRTSQLLLFSGVIWLCFFSLTYTADKLQTYLQSDFSFVPLDTLPMAEAIVVLGGSIEPLPELSKTSFNMSSAADRPVYAARLFHAGKAPLMLVSAGSLPWKKQEISEAESTTTFLVELGVKKEHIILETQSATTYENAIHSIELLRAKGISKILLVTSAWHMKRAKATYESVGFEVIPAPTDYESLRSTDYSIFDWFPNLDALSRSTQAIKEIIGLEVYRFKGWAK